MVSELVLAVISLRILAFILGGMVAVLALRGYRRSRSKSMLYLGFGVFLITLGSFVEGVVFEFTGLTNPVHALEAALVNLGFLIILYSIKRA